MLALKKPKPEEQPNLILYQEHLDKKKKEEAEEQQPEAEAAEEKEKAKFDLKAFAIKALPIAAVSAIAIILGVQILGDKEAVRDVATQSMPIATTNPNSGKMIVNSIDKEVEPTEEVEEVVEEAPSETEIKDVEEKPPAEKETTPTIEPVATVAPQIVPQVIKGIDGKPGATGAKGEVGASGKDGDDGRDGADGINGLNGIDGVNGQDGKDGLNGIDGVNGRDGKDGLNGIDGINGKSTYELAVEAGYTGSEEALAAALSTFETDMSDLHTEMDETKKYVSDGKSTVASAITNQGVSTAADATFEVLAANIAAIADKKYNDGLNAGKAGLYTYDQYMAQYNAGYNAGYSDGYAAGYAAVKNYDLRVKIGSSGDSTVVIGSNSYSFKQKLGSWSDQITIGLN